MKFMDESGDDGKYVGSNSEFFTISIIDIENYVKVYNDLKRKLDKKNYFLKWYKLNDKQKDIFINSIKDVDYKVKIFYADEYTQNHQAIVG